jgi:hypothetical protein
MPAFISDAFSTGREELGFRNIRKDKRRGGRYAKVVCTKTDETIYYLDREDWEGQIPNAMYNFMMGVYTAWTVDDIEAEMAKAFDLFPVVRSKDLAVIIIGWPLLARDEGQNHEIRYMEMLDGIPDPLVTSR